jgi:hypothetical protein
LAVGKNYIDNNCKDISEPTDSCVRCDFNDRKHLSTIINGNVCVEKNGIQFIFE